MKHLVSQLSLLLLAAPLASYATDQLIPAGSMITCRVAEGKISSKTTAVGDPVLCTLDPVERYGRSVFPYGSYLEGRFEDYKDPGHFVGKGWMELKFDRLITGNRVVPVSARVVEVPKYKVDKDGKILGQGHAVRDTVEWLIPVLWPIDLINLPRRGPFPVIKPETPLTLEVLDDVGIPGVDTPTDEQYPQRRALVERPEPQYQPQQYQQPAPVQQQAPAPVIVQNYVTPPQTVYVQSPPQTVYVQAPPRVVYRYVPPPPPPPVYYAYPPAYRYYGPGY